jgi:hypothetical protein
MIALRVGIKRGWRMGHFHRLSQLRNRKSSSSNSLRISRKSLSNERAIMRATRQR